MNVQIWKLARSDVTKAKNSITAEPSVSELIAHSELYLASGGHEELTRAGLGESMGGGDPVASGVREHRMIKLIFLMSTSDPSLHRSPRDE